MKDNKFSLYLAKFHSSAVGVFVLDARLDDLVDDRVDGLVDGLVDVPPSFPMTYPIPPLTYPAWVDVESISGV